MTLLSRVAQGGAADRVRLAAIPGAVNRSRLALCPPRARRAYLSNCSSLSAPKQFYEVLYHNN